MGELELRSSRGHAAVTAVVAVLLLPALVLGALDFHTTKSPHGVFDRSGVVLADARHPFQAEHLEASVAVHIAPCPACLLHHKTSCGSAAPPALAADAAIAAAPPATAVEPLLTALIHTLGSRGPPLA